ncbi:MAG: hypothetical protein N3A72_08115 [bacterium]|nr:hypothetical protein [bacterium]
MTDQIRKHVVFFGKLFIVIVIFLLIYLLWSIRYGYFSSDEVKLADSRKIIRFEVPKNYRISLVTNLPLAQSIVLDNSSTGQRISIQRRLWPRKDRLPQGFIARFNHPGKIVAFRTTFTRLKNPLILKHGNTLVTTHIVPYVLVEDRHVAPVKTGLVACVYCPITKKSYYITSSAEVDKFNCEEIIQFIQKIQCH